MQRKNWQLPTSSRQRGDAVLWQGYDGRGERGQVAITMSADGGNTLSWPRQPYLRRSRINSNKHMKTPRPLAWTGCHAKWVKDLPALRLVGLCFLCSPDVPCSEVLPTQLPMALAEVAH